MHRHQSFEIIIRSLQSFFRLYFYPELVQPSQIVTGTGGNHNYKIVHLGNETPQPDNDGAGINYYDFNSTTDTHVDVNISDDSDDSDSDENVENFKEFPGVSSCDVDVNKTCSKEKILRNNLANWASEFQIHYTALKVLLRIFNEFVGSNILPQDGRTLLQTECKAVNVQKLDGGNGEYWHNGLEKCLLNTFRNLNKPISISLNINVDGIPLYNSSRVVFWPILCTITEIPKMRPMVIGIYCGSAKITDLDNYFLPFVNELRPILLDGLHINSNKISVKVRCFICDSPARAFVKGTNIYRRTN